MLTYLLYIVHFIVCAILILVVLLQTGKGADLASAFGGASSQTFFGSRGTATVLSKVTIWSAILFLITSLSISLVTKSKPTTILEDVTEEEMMEEEAPQLPGATETAPSEGMGPSGETGDVEPPSPAEEKSPGETGTAPPGSPGAKEPPGAEGTAGSSLPE